MISLNSLINWRNAILSSTAAALALVSGPSGADDLAITRVQPDRTHAYVERNEEVVFRFELTQPATVTLQLFDGRDLRVTAIESRGMLAIGEHRMRWDLRDQSGSAVPPEAYTYILEARGGGGEVVRHDLADVTGGEPVTPRDIKWDAKRGVLKYVLEKPSRVNVRFGLNEGGPLMKTLINWVVRPAGIREEQWNGQDASGAIHIGAHPRLITSIEAFALPENTIIVGSEQTEVKLIERLTSESKQRVRAATQPKRMYAHSQQPLESRGDFNVRLSLPANVRRNASGVPVVSTPIPVRLEVDQKDRERALARRFEPVFFVDGQFAFENEVGFVPMTWNFDPAPLNEGEHYLTVNLRGYEGNFGVATLKIWVKRAAAAESAN